MGSCLSRKGLPTSSNSNSNRKKGNKDKQRPAPNQEPSSERLSSGAAPPTTPVDDEAVVKEVLTETPVPSTRAEAVRGSPDGVASAPASADDVCSCSLSEGFSAPTTLVGEATEDGETEVAGAGPPVDKRTPRELPSGGKGHHQRRRTSSGEFSSWRDSRGRTGGRSFSGRETTRTSLQQVGSQNSGAARLVRGDQGETSGRRSASPASRREASLRAGGGCGGGGGVGRINSLTRRGPIRRWPPPPRGGTAAGDASRKRVAGEGEEEQEEEGQVGAALLPGSGPEGLLEDPLVSLECFIFL